MTGREPALPGLAGARMIVDLLEEVDTGPRWGYGESCRKHLRPLP